MLVYNPKPDIKILDERLTKLEEAVKKILDVLEKYSSNPTNYNSNIKSE